MALYHHLLLLGSNQNKEAMLEAARSEIAVGLQILQQSCVYESEAVHSASSPPFHNQALLVASDKNKTELKIKLLEIEKLLGRIRNPLDKNAARPIDIDILISLHANGQAVDSDFDHDLLQHHHACLPACELVPQLVLPQDGRKLAEVLDSLGPKPRGFQCLPR